MSNNTMKFHPEEMEAVNRKRQHPANYPLFDCRRYIKPGDTILVAKEVNKYTKAVVLEVSRNWLKVIYAGTKVPTGVNRWDLKAVNGHLIREGSGCFQNLKCLPGMEVELKPAEIIMKPTFDKSFFKREI